MNRKTTRLEEIFNIEVSSSGSPSPAAGTSMTHSLDSRSSTPPPVNDLSGSRIPLTPVGLPDNFNGDNVNFIRSYSVDNDIDSMAGPSRSRGVSNNLYPKVQQKWLFSLYRMWGGGRKLYSAEQKMARSPSEKKQLTLCHHACKEVSNSYFV